MTFTMDNTLIIKVLIFSIFITFCNADCSDNGIGSNSQRCLKCIKRETFGRNCYWDTTSNTCHNEFFSFGDSLVIDVPKCNLQTSGTKASGLEELFSDIISRLSQPNLLTIIMSDRNLFRSVISVAKKPMTTDNPYRAFLKHIHAVVCPAPVQMLYSLSELTATKSYDDASSKIIDASWDLATSTCSLVGAFPNAGSLIGVGCAAADLVHKGKALSDALGDKDMTLQVLKIVRNAKKIYVTIEQNCKKLENSLIPDIGNYIENFGVTFNLATRILFDRSIDTKISTSLSAEMTSICGTDCDPNLDSLSKILMVYSTDMMVKASCPGKTAISDLSKLKNLNSADSVKRLSILNHIVNRCKDLTLSDVGDLNAAECTPVKAAYCAYRAIPNHIVTNNDEMELLWIAFKKALMSNPTCKFDIKGAFYSTTVCN